MQIGQEKNPVPYNHTFIMSIWSQIKDIASIRRQDIDLADASARIKKNIWFRGANVWILAFSIVIASVGLNVNSTAVIIGAMLISPLMGPIIGIGLALGTNDGTLMKNAAKNLLVMIAISLAASCLFFLISPLELANPTELEARTSPTIYDVLIALFGGLAGILESSRKEKGTVLSGVAIATALMPPLCTAGYGLAKGNWHYFSGAGFLFLINCVFIILATYVMVKHLNFPEADFENQKHRKRTRTIMMVIIALILVPSIFSAVTVVSDNNFLTNVQHFVAANKNIGKTYIYDYKVTNGKNRTADIFFAGQGLSNEDLAHLYSSAEHYGIRKDQINIQEHAMGGREEETDRLISSIYKRTDSEMSVLRDRIKELEAQLAEQTEEEIPYARVAREIRLSYPEIKDISFGRGAQVDDSLRVRECLTVIAATPVPMKKASVEKLEEWLRVRLNDSTAVVSNVTIK